MIASGRIAHFNVARLRHAPGDPRVAHFIDNSERVNAIAERSKGFIWRLSDEASAVPGMKYQAVAADPLLAISMSVWETLQDFQYFVHKTAHEGFLKRRTEWFEIWPGPNYVIWNFNGEHPLLIDEGWARLRHLELNGSSDHAFDFSTMKKP